MSLVHDQPHGAHPSVRDEDLDDMKRVLDLNFLI